MSDERDRIRQKMVLLGISRELFTHSLPLIAAEQCYEKLINDVRKIIVNSKTKARRDTTFELLIELIEDYNIRLLSTKVYWDKPEKREEYKKFWNKYKEIKKIEDIKEQNKQKQVLFLKNDLKDLNRSKENNKLIIKCIKQKLLELGAIRQVKNNCKTLTGEFKEIKQENKLAKAQVTDVSGIGSINIYSSNKWRIKIPKLKLDAPIAEGTTQEAMRRTVGHFEETDKWKGNVALAAHNVGYKCNFFQDIKKLKNGDEIIYSTEKGERKYKVVVNKIIEETDWQYIKNTKDNRITLITCEINKRAYRRCIQAIESI